MDDFNPDDMAELEATLARAEFEERATVVTYVEMPYTQAQELAEAADAYENGDRIGAAMLLLAFAVQFCESLGVVLAENENRTMDDD